MKRITTVAVTVTSLLFLCSTGASAQSWLDKLKNKTKDVVEESVDGQVDNATQEPKKSAPPSTSTSTSGKAAAPSSSQNQTSTPVPPSGETYGESFGAASYLVQKWPYDGVKGKPVKDIVLKGVKLGMPLPEAIEALDEEGFSRVTGLRFQRVMYEYNGQRNTLSRAEHSNLSTDKRGKIIRSYVVELEAITPSEPVMVELPDYPEEKEEKVKLTSDELERCKLFTSRNRTWSRGLSGEEVRALQDKCSRASGNTPSQQKDPEYVSRIWYGQKFISGEKVDYAAFREKAKETFGEPTYIYSEGATRAAGAAYNRSGMMWYVDSALVQKSKIAYLLEKCGDDDRSMVFENFIHPGDARNAFYPRAYKSMDDMKEALAVSYAPHMAIGGEKGAFVVDLEWPFLEMEKAYRRLREKQDAKKAQPEADVSF